MLLSKMDRADLEVAVLEHSILPCDTNADLDIIGNMSDDDLRDAITAWIAAGDECAFGKVTTIRA